MAEPVPPAPRSLTITDGGQVFTISGAAAVMIRMIREQASFFNAPYCAGAVHFHFSGKEQSANIKTDVDYKPQEA